YPDFTWNLARKVTSWVHFSMDTSTQIPGGWLATKYGGKMVFLTGITATAFLTLLTPALTKAGTGFLIALRILEGLFEGMTYPSIHAIWPNGRHHLKGVVWQGGIFWVLCRDRDCLALIRNASRVHQLGVHFLRLWSNWFGVVLCVWWVVRDSPDEDRKITDHELEYLRTAIGVSSQESMMSPPWKKMMTSRAVWAIIIAHFAENWGFYTLLTGLPICTWVQIGCSRISGGLSIPPHGRDVQSAGLLADHARTKGRLTTTQVRKLFTCGSYACQTIFMTLTALMMTRGSAVTFLSCFLGCGGFAWAGMQRSSGDIKYYRNNPWNNQPRAHRIHHCQRVAICLPYRCLCLHGGPAAYGLLASGERQDWSRIEGDEDSLKADENTFVSEASTAAASDYGTVRGLNRC
ncbi:hypothetical protein TCAL_15970, partial [Tigriopus californicus]